MVSTRQMCGTAGAAVNADASVAGVANSGNLALEETNMSTRTSVVKRTNNHNNQHQALVTSTPASLAYTARLVTNTSVVAKPTLNFLDLPPELIIKTLSYLDYKKIGNLRLVSHAMNDICMPILNSAFTRLINTTYNRFHAIKANMPRRESARRSHPLACECDIIETCYMRLSLLQMSMGKHIERGHCCFFPGAILDEVHSILNYISITPRLQRPYRVTDELFDLSTMAMEYFKDRIEPTLPGLAYFNKDFFQLPTTTKRPIAIASDLADSANNSPPQNHMVLRKGIRKIKQGMKMYNNQLSVLRTELRTCKRKAAEQSKQLAEQQNLLAEHQKQTLEYANRLDENDKKNEEMARKFSTLLQELNKCKTELQFWRSKSPAIPSMCTACNQKMLTPLLPPEDFQALINQGVDPEHIIINDDNDADAESDGSASELPMALERQFVFPDESTTAKLLAVNTAAKNFLKRKCQTEVETAATSNAITSQAMPSTSKAAADAAAAQEAAADAGYSTKLFYGNQQPRSGVIVSPVSIKLAPLQLQLANADGSTAAEQSVDNGASGNAEHDESKKARRVQKATRCVNTHGKRSK